MTEAQNVEDWLPIADRLLIEPDAEQGITKSGIYIPDTAKEKPSEGTVIALGQGVKDKSFSVKVGDKVKYSKYAGVEIEIGGTDYLVMRDSDMMLVKKAKEETTNAE